MMGCRTVGKVVTEYETTRSRFGFKGVDWCSPSWFSGVCPTTEITQDVCVTGPPDVVTRDKLDEAIAKWKAIVHVRKADFILPYSLYTYTYPLQKDGSLGSPTISAWK